MKYFFTITMALILFYSNLFGQKNRNLHYINNQPPLIAQPYTALPLGAIRANDFLLEMLKIQAKGLTGHLDRIYEVVCGDNNGWLGGTGDGWERGPYWIDGLVPLAYLLDDDTLKVKAQKWIEWSINNQQKDGYFGPRPLPEKYDRIPGTQQGMRNDWWPKMVMLKVLQQYYMATGDERVIKLMTNYFRYQMKMLPNNELGYVTFWANRRGGDNLAIVYWLYNITKDEFLLDLSEIIHKQTYDWTDVFSGNDIRTLNPLPNLHCVNVAQGLKEPIIYYQHHPEAKYVESVKNGLDALKGVHGFVNGMYGGDERLHGNDPTQGSELCSAVEMMYSFENIIPITGDIYYADYLEKIAYNVLPTQTTDDYMYKQYFQQVNQIKVSDDERNFFDDRNGRNVFGTTTGYPCCLTNMHQGWPKFIQSTWFATDDNGLAALVYGPTKVTAKVGKGELVSIKAETGYPFKEKIKFTIETKEAVKFPFHLRIPKWCKSFTLKVNRTNLDLQAKNGIVVLDREWKNGDKVELDLRMDFRFSYWHEMSLGIERGPLVYALKIKEEWREVSNDKFDDTFWEIIARSPWNYSIWNKTVENLDFQLEVADKIQLNPWNLKNAPITVKTKARRMPIWTENRNMAGKIPSPSSSFRIVEDNEEEITLIPYGCTTLRIAQFPVYKK
tara:strand:+ start:845 stop:2851 length:2007 start_codon:yes stop_codon:yes gene_type:complete